MDKKKDIKIIILVVTCMMLNFGGKAVGEALQLPLWLDCVGTVIAAYVLGPICGGIVGISVNIMYGAFAFNSYIYAIVNLAVGVLVGICAQRGWLNRSFQTFSVGIGVALVATILSTPLNIWFYDGMTSNLWGDGVIHYLEEQGFVGWMSYLLGEFYVDLVDKVLSVYLVYSLAKHRRNAIRKISRNSATLAVLIGVFGLFSCAAQVEAATGSDYDSYIQTIYNSTNGIPGGEVNAIAQTRDGMLWLGTYGGLYQYDGRNFTFMSHFDSVRNVNCLYTDEEGRLWIGTNDSGLSICANNEIVNVIDQDGGLPENSVRSIVKSSDGYYYVGTTGAMCVVALADGMQVTDIIEDLHYVKRLTSGAGGYVGAVTGSGSLAILRNGEILEMLTDSEGVVYTTAAFDERGYLYVATDSGKILKYEIRDDHLKKVKTMVAKGLSNINAIYMMENRRMVVCADNGIGHLDDEGHFYRINTANFDSSIDNILVDYQGNLWFSSSRLGLLELSESISTEIFAGLGLEESVVNTITKWDDRYLVGTDSGLVVINEKLTEVLDDPLMAYFAGIRLRCLMVDRQSHLWITTSGHGAYEVTPEGAIVKYDASKGLASDKTRSLLELQNGNIAVATDDGISFIADGEIVNTVGQKDGLVTAKTLCLNEKDGRVFAGTDGGGIAVIDAGKVVRVIRRKEGLSSDVVLRMRESSDGQGLIIITSNGLNYMDYEGNIRQLNQFPYYNNYDLIPANDGRIWVIGSAGIYIVDEKELLDGEALDYELLDSKKGLRGNFTANAWNYQDRDTNLFICGDQGVVRVNMGDYGNQRTSYRITLENLLVDGNFVPVDKEEINSISRSSSRVEFFPQVINFSASNPYVSVWLEGFDKEPKVVLQSELESMVYTNLPSGEYVFHLAILDHKQTSIVEEISYRFVKEKEIYDNWWFSLYLLVILAIITIYLVWLIIGSQIEKNLRIQKQEFENLKLKQAKDAAVAAGEAKDQFLALMSHDIRTPINAILGMNEMILRDCKDEKAYEYARDIKGAGNTLLSLVNMILDYSKIEQGKMELVPVQYETQSLIHNLVQGVLTRAENKHLELKVDVDENIPKELFGDDVRIIQVISNLLTNAVKYTEKGYVSLTVRLQEKQEDKCRLFVEVKDTGIGIKEEDMGRLFESFQRLDEKRNRNIEGSGLGMSIVTSLLQLMDSELQVESVYGVGSRFFFALEQKIVNQEPIGSMDILAKEKHEREEGVHVHAKGAKVLVVDDNSMNLKVAVSLLRINEIVPDTASSGEAAIELVRQNTYDLIFMDHMMPEMDGIETLEILKKEELLPKQTKVVILTANAVNGAKEQYLKAGFDDYMTKPIDVVQLEKKLLQHLPNELVEMVKIDTEKAESGHRSEVNDGVTNDAAMLEKLGPAAQKLAEICPEISIETGLKYCMDSMEFYVEVISEYVNGNKANQLAEFFEKKDYHNYRVLIHSMKSNSMSIGAIHVSEMAKELELAAKEENVEFIEKEHEPYMKAYRQLLSQLTTYLEQ